MTRYGAAPTDVGLKLKLFSFICFPFHAVCVYMYTLRTIFANIVGEKTEKFMITMVIRTDITVIQLYPLYKISREMRILSTHTRKSESLRTLMVSLPAAIVVRVMTRLLFVKSRRSSRIILRRNLQPTAPVDQSDAAGSYPLDSNLGLRP